MLTPKLIVDRIKEILIGQYPESTFYIQSVPENISRPSFNIYIDCDRSETDSLTLTNETFSVGILYYAPQGGSEPEGLKPLAVYSNIKDIFRKGHIQVGDRALKVVLIRGGSKGNEIFLIIKLVYVEIRPREETVYETVGGIYLETKYNK